MMSTSSTSPIPQGLRQLLPNQETPWYVNNRLFKRFELQPYGDDANTHKICPLFQGDPEVGVILKYFNHNKPSNHSIANIHCIHTPSLTKKFEAHIETMNTKSEKLKPEWEREDRPDQRRRVIHRWRQQVNEFCPVTFKQSGKENSREDTYSNVGVLLLWHGTSEPVCRSVAASGFLCPGNHHLLRPTARAGQVKKIDSGYFGNGYYFTNSAKYASMYGTGHLLLTWTSMTEPFPVISDVPHPDMGSDMKKLKGLGSYQTYNTHFAPVAPTNNTPGWMECYPCYEGQDPEWDEFVFFQEAQMLPRFSIELSVDLTTELTLRSYPAVNLPNLIALWFETSSNSNYGKRDLWSQFFRNYLRTIGTSFLLGAMAGSGLGLMVESGIDPSSQKPTPKRNPNLLNVFFCALLGGFLGGGVGFFCGRGQNRQFALDYKQLDNQLNRDSSKAARIITAFVTSQLRRSAEQINCPLSETLLLFPARVKCGSLEPHIFEYYSIMKWISEHHTCPTCKTGEVIGIEHVVLNKKKKKVVIEEVHRIFLHFESLLAGLPIHAETGAPDFSEAEQSAYLIEKIKKGSSLLQMNAEQVVAKIKQQDSLLKEERYALGYYIAHQIRPMKEKVDKIFTKSCSLIAKFETQTTDERVWNILDEHSQQLKKWHRQKDALFPQECKILHHLYHTKMG